MSSLINQTLLSQFRVDAFIASGGMGSVYRVWDLKRNVPLAMKVLHAELAEDPSIFKRFQREANALKKLAHPNIVPFYGLYHTLDFAFLLERFIDGPSLKEILHQQKGKVFSIPETLIYFKALCAALGYAHSNRVVHCDVKPGNVMVDQGGNIYLTDFGVARHADSTTTTLGAAGTPAYMAPEHILGKAVTPATDVYSLGVMLFEMLTGQRPFRGTESGTEKSGSTVHERIRYGHLHVPPPDPTAINPSISKPVAEVILKAMNKTPSERYPSAAEFFAALCIAAEVSSNDVADRAALPNISPEPSNMPSPEGPEISQKPKVVPRWGIPFSRRPWSTRGPIVFGILVFALIGISVLIATTKADIPFPMTQNTSTPVATDTLQVLPSPIPEPPRFFVEGFSDQFTNNWETFITNGEKNGLNLPVDNGSLVFNIVDPNLWAYLTYKPQTYNDVQIDVRVENRGEDSGVNIICNYDGQQWYEFRIASNGLYGIYYQALNSDQVHSSQFMIADGGSNKIKNGENTNEYSVVCSGETLSLSINGTLTRTVTDKDHVMNEGKIGIGVFSYNRVPVILAVDQLKVSQP